MEERKDPLSLWVGSWTPEEVVERETPRMKPQDPFPKDPKEAQKPRPR